MRIRSWAGNIVTSSPKKCTRPRVAGKSPVTTLNSVVLPAPLAPMTARRSPTATENETSSIARRAPNVRVTPSNTRASPETSVDVEAISRSGWPRNHSRGAPRLRRGAPNVGGCGGPFLGPPLRAVRLVARADLELGGRDAQRLVHVVDLLEHLVVQVALRVLHHLGDEGGADRLPVGVELDVADRALEDHLAERVAVLLLPVREVALHRFQAVERRLHVEVVHEREQRRARIAVGEVLLVVGHERLPLWGFVGIGDRRARDGANQRIATLALVVQDVLAHRDGAADHRLVTAGLLVLVQEVHSVGAAQHN